jgi:hypothetical protein
MRGPAPVGGPAQWTDDYFVYNVNVPSLATGAISTQTFQVQADSDFEWMMTTAYGTITAPTEPYSDASVIPVTVQITDSGSARNLFLNAVPLNTIAGSGKQPYILPQPRIFQARSTVTCLFTSISANTQINIFMCFHGRKIFSLG